MTAFCALFVGAGDTCKSQGRKFEKHAAANGPLLLNLELVAHRKQEQKEQHGAEGRLHQGLNVADDEGNVGLVSGTAMAAIQAEIGLIDARVARAAEHYEPVLNGEVERLPGATAVCGEPARRL
jgi:hypothetical protein